MHGLLAVKGEHTLVRAEFWAHSSVLKRGERLVNFEGLSDVLGTLCTSDVGYPVVTRKTAGEGFKQIGGKRRHWLLTYIENEHVVGESALLTAKGEHMAKGCAYLRLCKLVFCASASDSLITPDMSRP